MGNQNNVLFHAIFGFYDLVLVKPGMYNIISFHCSPNQNNAENLKAILVLNNIVTYIL